MITKTETRKELTKQRVSKRVTLGERLRAKRKY